MKKLIIAMSILLMVTTSALAREPRRHADCECDAKGCIDSCKACDKCRKCLKDKRMKEVRKQAKEEAKKRRQRLERSRIAIHRPRVVIGFNFPVYRSYYNGWGMRRSWRRPINVYINMGPRIGRLHHHHHPHRGRYSE